MTEGNLRKTYQMVVLDGEFQSLRELHEKNDPIAMLV